MLRIGEFARVGSVSVATLRHYHDLGLLVPAVVDPATGYRWYSAAQLPRLSRIVALKDLGFSLDQVELLIAEVTADELRGMLMLRRAQVETDLGAQRDRLARIETRLRMIDKEGTMPKYEIAIKPLPVEHVAVLGGSVESWEPDALRPILEPAYAHLITLLAEHDIDVVGPPFDFFLGDPDAGDLMAYAAVPIASTVEEVPFPARVADLPAVDEAVSVIVADVRFETFVEVYADFARWAEEHGCELVGWPRERLVTTDRPVNDRDAVLELQQVIHRPGFAEPDVTPIWRPTRHDDLDGRRDGRLRLRESGKQHGSGATS